MKPVFWLLAALSLTMVSAAADASQQQAAIHWFGKCSSAAPTQSCLDYVSGLLDGAQMQAFATAAPPAFCIPAGTPIEAVAAIFDARLRRHPEWLGQSAPTLFLGAMRETFPCR